MSKWLQKLEFKILENDHDNREGAAERKWKAIITKSNYIKKKITSALKSAHCTIVNVYHFLQLQLHSRRSWDTFGTDENTLKIFPASDLLNTFSARTDCLRSCTRYSTIPSNTSCIACRCTWTLCRLRATEVCRGCPRPWAPTRRWPASCCAGTSRAGGLGGGWGTWVLAD